MLRSFLLLICGSAAAAAGTVYVNAACAGITIRDDGMASCSGPESGSSARAGTSVEAYANNVWPDHPVRAVAEARADYWYQLTITPADTSLTAGTYVPCLSAFAGGTRGDSSSYAQWNSVVASASRTGQGEWSETCVPQPQAGSGIEVSFGVAQLVHVTYYAYAEVFLQNAQVQAFASGGPLVVFDEFGSPIADVTWSLTEVPAPVPEPRTLVPLSILLSAFVLGHRMSAG